MVSEQKKPTSRAVPVAAAIVIVIVVAIIAGAYYTGRPAAPAVVTSTSSHSSAVPLPIITLAAGSIGANGLIARVITDYHLDEKYGFNLKVLYVSISAGEEDLIARTVDVDAYGPIPSAQEQLKGHDIVIFAPLLNQQNSILVRSDSGISSLNDLVGKRVGFDPKVTTATHNWQIFLNASGLNMDKDFKVTYADLAARIVLFERGQLDAIAIFEPNTSKLLVTGKYKEIATAWDLSTKLFGTDTPFAGLACYRDWYTSHTGLAEKLKAANNEAISIVNKDPVGILTKYAKVFGLANETQIKFVAKRILEMHLYATEWDQKSFNAIDKILDAAVKAGVIPKLPSNKVYEP